MRLRIPSIALFLACLGSPALATAAPDRWAAYLDYAYIYASAEPATLAARLDGYARETGVTLEDYIAQRFSTGYIRLGESDQRRKAVAHFLQYGVGGDPAELDAASLAIAALGDRLERHENRYWYHYIRANRALEEGNTTLFVKRTLELWREVVLELETPYETYRTLSIDASPTAGFVAALPYLYENVARLVLLRSQEMGVDRGLDPLAAVVRFLADGRIGAYPDVVPPEASSEEYLDAIVSRLNGPESDGGSLTFTLALFEATKYHGMARSLLATEGLSPRTLETIRLTVGAYESALSRARTLQGKTAVYARALRQLGEVYAAKRRLGVDPDIEIPFSIEQASQIYSALHADRNGDWGQHGYRNNGRESYRNAMRTLWEEIQEASFNAAAFYLGRRGVDRDAVDEAVRSYSRYLALFERFSEPASVEVVPDSAYFSAYVAARGVADAVLGSADANPSTKQLDAATDHYLAALAMFPFDRSTWSSLAVSLERQGREGDYLSVTRSTADSMKESRALDSWIDAGKPEADSLGAVRGAIADDLAIMYLGFSNESDLETLAAGIDELRERRDSIGRSLASLEERRQDLAAVPTADPNGLPEVSAPRGPSRTAEISALTEKIAQLHAAGERLGAQIEARERALPLFESVIGAADITPAIASQRDHPLHSLVRRMFYENTTTGATTAASAAR